MTLRFALICLAVAMLSSAGRAASTAVLHYTSCAGIQSAHDAKCASLRVFENREKHLGRQITLSIVVLPAKERNAAAIFELSGGPGQSAIDDVPFVAQQFQELRRSHDLVFVAQRGTRYSHQLQCPLYVDPATYFRELFPSAPLQVCRARLARFADLNEYGTSIAADDLDDARSALGYDKIELYGGSYGTEAAQVYARRHPAHVRAILLESVATTNFLVPLPYARGAQRALDQLFAACAAESECRRAFPSLRSHFATLLNRFGRSGLHVKLGGRNLTLSHDVFVDRLRQLLYSPQIARMVPIVIEDAYSGNAQPLATALDLITKSFADSLSWGMSMSVNCSEDDAFITPAAALAAGRNTFLGTARTAAQHRACLTWHVKPAPRSYLEPVRSNAPILMLSGSDDPATPPQYALTQLRYYPNGRVISIPHGGHDNETSCLDRIRVAFLGSADAKAVDARCIEAFRRPPFILTDKELNALFASVQ